MYHSATIYYGLVWKILPQFSSQLIWRSIVYQKVECKCGGKQSRRKLNRILKSVVAMTKYKKIEICHSIYIKDFFNRPVSYLTVSTDDDLNITNNET